LLINDKQQPLNTDRPK